MNVLTRLIVFVISFSSLFVMSYSAGPYNICGVGFAEPWFETKNSQAETILLVDLDGDTFIMAENTNGVVSESSETLYLGDIHIGSENAGFSSITQLAGSLPASQGIVIRDPTGNDVAKFTGTTLTTVGFSAHQGSQAACLPDGNYCSGISLETRDYFCDVFGNLSGACTYTVTGTTNCLVIPTLETDSGNAPNTPGEITDYDGCSGDSCSTTTYQDYCQGNSVVEYFALGAGYNSQTYDCSNNDYTYCSGTEIWEKTHTCSGTPGSCQEVGDQLVETCQGRPTSYGSWSCSDSSTATRIITNYQPVCASDPFTRCQVNPVSSTQTVTCSQGEICQAGSGCQDNTAPTCSLSVSPSSGTGSTSVTLSGSYNDPDSGDTITCTLDFGDGSGPISCSSSFSTSHTYSSTSTATLTVTDSVGATCTDTEVITIGTGGVCTEGDTRSTSCQSSANSCGMRNTGTMPQICSGGVWIDDGSCSASTPPDSSCSSGSCVIDIFDADGNPDQITLEDGGEIELFGSYSVPYGDTCTSQTITCNSGTTSGGSNQYLECGSEPAESCTNPTLGHGETGYFYADSTVAPGQSCQGSEVSCFNGVISPSGYTNPNCEVEITNGVWSDRRYTNDQPLPDYQTTCTIGGSYPDTGSEVVGSTCSPIGAINTFTDGRSCTPGFCGDFDNDISGCISNGCIYDSSAPIGNRCSLNVCSQYEDENTCNTNDCNWEVDLEHGTTYCWGPSPGGDVRVGYEQECVIEIFDAQWQTGSFGQCIDHACFGNYQYRSVTCMGRIGNPLGALELVPETYCSGSKPSKSQSCSPTQSCGGNWNNGDVVTCECLPSNGGFQDVIATCKGSYWDLNFDVPLYEQCR